MNCQLFLNYIFMELHVSNFILLKNVPLLLEIVLRNGRLKKNCCPENGWSGTLSEQWTV